MTLSTYNQNEADEALSVLGSFSLEIKGFLKNIGAIL
jgi:hypothetical protein